MDREEYLRKRYVASTVSIIYSSHKVHFSTHAPAYMNPSEISNYNTPLSQPRHNHHTLFLSTPKPRHQPNGLKIQHVLLLIK